MVAHASMSLLSPERDAEIVANHVREGRFQCSLSLITAASSLISGLEVAYEHYRGSYSRRVMYTPVILSGVLAAAGVAAIFSRKAARTVLRMASVVTLMDAGVGFYFHVRGIQRKPGGWRLPMTNMIMGPPVFAPLLFGTAAYLGLVASFLQREDEHDQDRGMVDIAFAHFLPARERRELISEEQDIREGRFQKQVAIVTAASAMLSGFEAFYSHYKNRFRYKVQWTPVVLAPLLAAVALASIRNRRLARTALPVLSAAASADAVVGFYFHARGVMRRPGGLKHWLYNILYGPPIFAPLLFGAAGMMGILASMLRRSSR
jgi:hypothetical protein